MAPFIEDGTCPWMYLWNPVDIGYLSGYTMDALVKGTITGDVGGSFNAGDLGEKEDYRSCRWWYRSNAW